MDADHSGAMGAVDDSDESLLDGVGGGDGQGEGVLVLRKCWLSLSEQECNGEEFAEGDARLKDRSFI